VPVDWRLLMDVTADFVYCRLHGSEELYVSGYDDKALDSWRRGLMIERMAASRQTPIACLNH
jgi:uncharacterized protein YecE (DUF72 family)